jgi:hypothetical protein
MATCTEVYPGEQPHFIFVNPSFLTGKQGIIQYAEMYGEMEKYGEIRMHCISLNSCELFLVPSLSSLPF